MPIKKILVTGGNRRLFAKHPILGVGVVIMRLGEYTGAALGILKSYISPSQIKLESKN